MNEVTGQPYLEPWQFWIVFFIVLAALLFWIWSNARKG